MLLNNLNEKFKEFVHGLLIHIKDKTLEFNEIIALLYEEERLLKKNIKEQALFSAINKFNKEQEEKKRSALFNRGRGGNSNNSNALKLFKNLNSSNYKGDGKSSECFKCFLTKTNKKRAY